MSAAPTPNAGASTGAVAAVQCLCSKLFPAGTVNLEHLALAVGFQVIVGLVWFGLLFVRWRDRALAAEKGVTDAAHILTRFHSSVPGLTTIGACIIRALAIIAFANAFKTCYCNGAALVFFTMLASVHHDLWGQRLFATTLLHSGFELTVSFATAWFLQFLKTNY